MLLTIIKLLVAFFVVCLVLAAFHRKEVQEGFVSAYEQSAQKASRAATVDEAAAKAVDASGRAGSHTKIASKCTACVTEDCKKGRYDLPAVKSYACLATYEDPSTAPVFLEDTWASPDASFHVGTMLPTFHFDEHQGFG